jgi:hypothetical protein
MSLFIGDLHQYGIGHQQQQQFPTQLQLLHHQQQLLLQEIALKKAQLVQQQQHQLALYHQRQQAHAQHQKQQLLNQSNFYNQAMQYNNHHKLQQAAVQAQQLAQSRAAQADSPLHIESDNSDDVSHNKRYDDIEDWEIPPKDLILKINQQVEYYFSNEYLTRDAYFLRQIRRKREGYLSMKLITNFKKVRKLVKDPRITSYCLRHSQHLQVNEDGTKVRRKFPIPENLSRFAVSRSLLIRSLPDRLASIECLMSIFYQFGDITSVRVLRPGKEIPHDLRDGLGKLILTDIAAVVEFETTESAANAFHRFSINNEIAFDNVPYELNVSLMGTGMEEELDSGCGSSSSGDESSGNDLCKFLISTNEDCDDDYEEYMRSMRKERKQENKEDVPDVIAALMDEYGEACTIPQAKNAQNARENNATLKYINNFDDVTSNDVTSQTVRKPTTSVWATNEGWGIHNNSIDENNDEENAKIQDILTGSALSAFGSISLDCSFDQSGDFMSPPIEETNQIKSQVQPAAKPKAWATVARK